MSDLARVTGLGKSSLYNYFPGGKEEMVEAVLERADSFITNKILGVAQTTTPLSVRIRKIVDAIEQFYADGRTACLLGQLATAPIGSSARETLSGAFELWIIAVAKLGCESGLTPECAREFGEDWVTQFQGALIVHGATRNIAPFERTMKRLLELSDDRSEFN